MEVIDTGFLSDLVYSWLLTLTRLSTTKLVSNKFVSRVRTLFKLCETHSHFMYHSAE